MTLIQYFNKIYVQVRHKSAWWLSSRYRMEDSQSFLRRARELVSSLVRKDLTRPMFNMDLTIVMPCDEMQQ